MSTVLRLAVRRDRVVLPIWILGLALVTAGSASTVTNEFGDATGRAQVLRLGLGTPALLALRGTPNGSSAGSLIFFQLFTFLAVVAGLMNTFLATRHGRADEESGRRELLAATEVRRSAPLSATVLLGVVANILLAACCAAAVLAAGLPIAGAALFGAALGAVGFAFLGVGMLAGELAPSGRAANSAGVAVVLAAYALRAAGDALGTPDATTLTLAPAWPSALTPIGWGEATLALTANRPAPLLLCIAFAAVTIVLAAAVHARRDLGTSVLPERLGPASAGALLRGPFGRAVRLNRGVIVGWTIGAALLGVAVGALAHTLTGFDNASVDRVVTGLGPGGGSSLITEFLAAMLSIVGMLAGAAAVQSALRLRQDEARAETLFSTGEARGGATLAAVAVAWVAAVAVVAVTGVATAISLVATENAAAAPRALGQALAELPAAVTIAGVAALAVALLPRIAVGITWAVFALAVVAGLFGRLFDLPDAVRRISPFANVPALPTNDWTPTIMLLAIDLALPLAAAVLARRRDWVA